MKPHGKSKTRQSAILKHLTEHRRATVDDLSDRFATTPQTIRKDLNVLAETSQIIRFHGGAAVLAGTEYTDFETRRELAKSEKESIGRAVAARIPNASSVMINSGSTTLAAARHLAHHVGLRVVTDSVSVANEIRGFAGLEVMVPAGVVRSSDGAILGESAVDFIRQFRSDIAVIGAAAIAPDGALLDYDLREASVARAIIENARTVILAADSSKFGRLAPIRIGDLGQVDTLVTDPRCPAQLASLCADKSVELLRAE